MTADNVIAIGGNVLQSVRHRRYPLDANGHLIVNQNQLYAQEEDSGNLPNVPASTPTAGLGDYSTGRIFALLGPIEICGTLPGQQAGGGMQSI